MSEKKFPVDYIPEVAHTTETTHQKKISDMLDMVPRQKMPVRKNLIFCSVMTIKIKYKPKPKPKEKLI